MKIPTSLPFRAPKLSRSNTWRLIAATLFVMLVALLASDAIIFLRYGIGWSAGVKAQQYEPIALNVPRLTEATRVVGRREDVRATRDYGLLPRNIFR